MATQKERVVYVLKKLAAGFEAEYFDEIDANIISYKMEDLLDELAGEDFFGTEGQLDPRGSGRDGYWCMDHVQGIDNEL